MWIFALAFLPSIVWLAFFFLQDKHREPKRIVAIIFLWGFFAAIPVIIIEAMGQNYFLPLFENAGIGWLYAFLIIAFVEEAAKYLVVYAKAIHLRAFNEPQDAILYMVTAALGFAAIENFFYAVAAYDTSIFPSLGSLGGRFLTSTFLHVVSSGFMGYFLARALFAPHRHKSFIVLGLTLSTALHGLYNHFIIREQTAFLAQIPFPSFAILVFGGAILLFLYRHLRTFSY